KDFLSDLNLATGCEIGYGGVFVLQSPYLLFYPDKNRDDIPDGDPEVLVIGFGMEDSHAYANSLTWGPDGWLYGAQGSTSTAHIGDLVFNQGIWRYHPITKKFELFAEGGGNTWGVDFDSHGNVIAGTNWGGFASLHQVQGGYYIKNFGKHGELMNPYAFGYFNHIPHPNFKGGHVTCGGIVYHGGALPERYEGEYIGANLLSNSIQVHSLTRNGSTFNNEYVGDLLDAHDPWFRPVDCTLGPDGSVFVADWQDKRATHVDPKDDWDRTNGRIYKIEAEGMDPVPVFDLHKKTSAELIELLNHPNHWYRRKANRLLAERKDESVIPSLLTALRDPNNESPVEKLWALYVSGGFNETIADELLDHENEDVRTWTVRFLGEQSELSEEMADRLAQRARVETSPVVRSQMASSCKRFSGDRMLPIFTSLAQHDEDVEDPFIPLLLWWALEDKAVSHSQGVLELFENPNFWSEPMVKGTLVERLARRYTADPTDLNLVSAGTLFTLAPDQDSRNRLITGFAKGLQGKTFEKIPQPLATILLQVLDKNPSEEALAFALRLGHPGAVSMAIDQIGSNDEETAKRVRLIEILGEISHPDALLPLVHLVGSNAPEKVQEASLRALENYSDPAIPKHLYSVLDQVSGNIRSRSINLLAGKEVWTLEFLKKVDSGEIPQDYATLTPLRRMMLHKNEQIADLVEKHYGKIGQESQGLLKGRIRGVTSILGLNEGNAEKGHELFLNTCAKCHTLFGEGNEIGPELTSMDRKNREWLITNIVDPNSIIRPEYQSHVIETADGAILTGMLAQSTEDAVTLITSENETITFPRDEIEEIYESKLSLMPEGLLDPMQPEEVQNLFAYLMKEE
ncbi:MAG: c-type cytochrome, partial [Candidatus Omnitrophica bacterium]|nr:c-type cytochrome [Candidatus Omnitrophota bacterium]